MKSSYEETWKLAQGVCIADINSEVKWNRGRAWISRCKTDHPLCQQLAPDTAQDVHSVFTLTPMRNEDLADINRKESQRPARLIDIDRNSKNFLIARLKETRDFDEMPAYATMSHC